jgi:phytoene dehydrogenase-like protein
MKITKKKPDSEFLIVGGGISGMAMALLLAAAGRSVTLLEKSAVVGGCMQRFVRDGIPLDTGFHFTGGFNHGLPEMLAVLGLHDDIREEEFRTHIFLADRLKKVSFSTAGVKDVCDHLCSLYQDEAAAIQEYYTVERRIFDSTPIFKLREKSLSEMFYLMDEDFITLDDFFNKENISQELRTILGAVAMCHGTPPCEVPLTTHCRISFGLTDHISRVCGGGGSFISGFQREAGRMGINVRTGVTIAECLDIDDSVCHRVRLTDGSELSFVSCVMSLHPMEMLKILPASMISPHFRSRISSFEESCGFFSLYAEITPPLPDFRQELTSWLSVCDLNKILKPGNSTESGMGIVLAHETTDDGRPCQTLTAFESMFPDETARWDKTSTNRRDEGYAEYKARRIETMKAKVTQAYPELRNKLRVMESASMLTFRDYLSTSGSGYGIRQKIGQHNLFGRLPVNNFYAVGQNAILPGMLGSMVSSFVIFRRLIGENSYWRLIEQRLGKL